MAYSFTYLLNILLISVEEGRKTATAIAPDELWMKTENGKNTLGGESN